jgi:hypothetical protein
MNLEYYLEKFEKVTSELNKKTISKKQIEIETGIWLDSVVLRIYKKHWANKPLAQPQSDLAIFFSIWLNDKTIKASRIFYNIHSLKLRQLKDYIITSREFAAAFREQFKKFETQWPNVSVNYGPQTLMEGWIEMNDEHLEKQVAALAHNFLEIDFIIEDLLIKHKKANKKYSDDIKI